jgi:hypothetical protein
MGSQRSRAGTVQTNPAQDCPRHGNRCGDGVEDLHRGLENYAGAPRNDTTTEPVRPEVQTTSALPIARNPPNSICRCRRPIPPRKGAPRNQR